MTLHRSLVFSLLASLPLIAQPPGNGPRIVAAGFLQLNSADPRAAQEFWQEVIGAAPGDDVQAGVSMIGATILFNKKAPSGPSGGSTIDHLAIKVPELQPFADRLAKTKYKSSHPAADETRLMIEGPDGVRVELMEDNTMFASREFNHIHLHSAQPKEMQEWYLKNLGGRAGTGENENGVQLQGATLLFSKAESVAPSANRAIDHLAFEVKDLTAFCGKLTENGVKLDTAPHAVAERKASVAVLTDPWGTTIELLERAGQ